ncbi:MAG: elongation factor P maturation arginine rhamnosyltransferase EarP [Methylophilaceae bacterium]|nr:elongation factor P maturation arginine rhamnosyltransferase EarP [Methylophilaceae bacterium]
MTKHWDIFCRIVDNYGDIGVCWRLAKQLANEYHQNVRLFVDLPETAQKIIPVLIPQLNQQMIDGVNVCILHYPDNPLFDDVADVVIEAFTCGLPTQYIATMQLQLAQSAHQHTKWLNLEYLSAEIWVDDFHAKPSLQPITGLTKTYFFPGFTQATGGLSREKSLIVQRDCFLESLKTKISQTTASIAEVMPKQAALNVSLFCYPNAPIQSALQTFAKSPIPINLYVPESVFLQPISKYLLLENNALNKANTFKKDNLTIQVLPFLSQDEYDRLLWRCDINFVRGEDSWLRAIWSANPMIWQPYFQDDAAHLVKLDAFLNHYCATFNSPAKTAANLAVKLLSLTWSNALTKEASFTHAWLTYIEALPDIKNQTQVYSQKLALQPSLGSNLVDFCNQ